MTSNQYQLRGVFPHYQSGPPIFQVKIKFKDTKLHQKCHFTYGQYPVGIRLRRVQFPADARNMFFLLVKNDIRGKTYHLKVLASTQPHSPISLYQNRWESVFFLFLMLFRSSKGQICPAGLGQGIAGLEPLPPAGAQKRKEEHPPLLFK